MCFCFDSQNMCQICEEVCHRASRCPWVYSHCSKGNCDGLMMMVTSQQEETFGKKYLKCQYQSCGTWKWLEDAIAAAEVKKQDEQSAGCSNICIYCGQSGHWVRNLAVLPHKPSICHVIFSLFITFCKYVAPRKPSI